MKRILALATLLMAAFAMNGAHAAPAAQQVIYCNLSTLAACNSLVNPGSGSEGDAGYVWAGKDNANFTKLFDMFGSGSNLATLGSASATDIIGLWSGCSSSTPVLGYQGACVAGGGSGGASTFDQLGSGTNTSATMTVGSGASLGFTGTGSIAATTAVNLANDPTQCTVSGQFATGVAANGNANCATPTGSGTVNAGTAGLPAVYTSPTGVSSLSGALSLGAGFTTAGLGTCNGTNKGDITYTTDGTASLTFCNGIAWVNHGGTPFTATGSAGCTISTTAGDATGGDFIVGTGCTPGTATVTITFNGSVGMSAGHLWVCTIYDYTLQHANSWFGDWGPSSYTTTTVTIPIPLAATIGDEIDFACGAH